MPKYIGGKKQKLYCGGVKIRKQYCQNNKIYSSGNFVYYNVDGKVYSEEFDEGLSVLNPSSFVPTKTGWEFVGWRSDTVASASVISSLVMGDNEITLYAVFRQTVVVTYYNDSTTPKTDTKYRYYNSGNVVNPTFKLSQASKSGWTARGWSTGTNANSDITYANNAEFQRDTNIALYGMYYQNITVTYYNNSSYASNSVGTRYYNSNGSILNPRFALSQATRSGWTAVGWSTSNTATGAIVYGDGVEFARDSNITLYGRYNQTITVTYYDDSTTAKTTSGTRYYNSIGNVSNPKFTLTQSAKSGWTARGWSTGTSGNAAITYENGAEFTRESNVVIYGMYQQSITLSYNGNGATSGSINSQSSVRYYNSNGNYVNPLFVLAANTFERAYYTFSSWDIGRPGATVTLDRNTTANAVWKQNVEIYGLLNGLNAYGNYTTGIEGIPSSVTGKIGYNILNNWVLAQTGSVSYEDGDTERGAEHYSYITWRVDVTNLSSIRFKGSFQMGSSAGTTDYSVSAIISGNKTKLAGEWSGAEISKTFNYDTTISLANLTGVVDIQLRMGGFTDVRVNAFAYLLADGASITVS